MQYIIDGLQTLGIEKRFRLRTEDSAEADEAIDVASSDPSRSYPEELGGLNGLNGDNGERGSLDIDLRVVGEGVVGKGIYGDET